MKFSDVIASMSFVDYCIAFGTLWLEGEDGVLAYRPWEFWEGYDGEPGQLDVAEMLEECKIFWAPKARQKGISEIWSLYAKYTLEKYPNSDAAVFSAGSKQAKEFMEKRFKRKVDGCLSAYSEIPWPKWEVGKDRAECDNGSYIQLYSSDNTGARGGSPRLTLLDEAREYADNDFKDMLASIFPVLRGKNQLAVVSSGKPGSSFNSRIKGMMKAPSPRSSVWRKGNSGMIFLNDFLDPEHRNPAWRENELSENFDGDRVRFNSEYPEKIEDIFTSHDGRVIGSLDEKIHRRPMELSWGPEHDFYLVYDHGNTEGHPSVANFIRHDRYADFAYGFDHVFTRAKPMPETGPKILETLNYYRDMGAPPPTCIADGSIFNDYGTGVKTVGVMLEEITGLQFLKARKADKAGSVEAVIRRFFHHRVAIHPRCVDGWKQLDGWMWNPKKDEPSEIEDDYPDTWRYFDAHVNKLGPPPPPLSQLQQQIQRFRMKERMTAVAAERTSSVGLAGLNDWMGAQC